MKDGRWGPVLIVMLGLSSKCKGGRVGSLGDDLSQAL